MAELTSIPNMEREIERKLKSAGICSAEELTRLGSKEAFVRLKMRYPNVYLVYPYTPEGAVSRVAYDRLTDEAKRDLKNFRDGIK